MSNEQKLREALQAISDIDDSINHAVDASAALGRIGRIARQALALPTAEQVDDINVADSFTNDTKPTTQAQEPFGYFKPEPFGWTDCEATDEGAIALYEHPAADLTDELVMALEGLDEAYCRAGAPLTKDERHQDRMRLINARAIIAKVKGVE